MPVFRFIHKFVDVSHSKQIPCINQTDCILYFHNVVLLSYWLHSCMHLACMFECLHAFQTKINRIYQREFSGVSMETSAILYSRTSTSNNLNKSRKRINQFIQVFSYELCKKFFKGKYIFLSYLIQKIK